MRILEVKNEYRKEEGRLLDIFRKLLYYEYGVSGPKADKVYSLAWEKGHSSGFTEIALNFGDFVELIKD